MLYDEAAETERRIAEEEEAAKRAEQGRTQRPRALAQRPPNLAEGLESGRHRKCKELSKSPAPQRGVRWASPPEYIALYSFI